MIDKKKILAVIPARAGSKRLPKKNKKILHDKPLIEWTIKAALKSKYLDEITISTDDRDIQKIGEKNGIKVPFLRPKYLAEDSSKSLDVLLHVVNLKENEGKNFDIIILLQPTSPLRTDEDIDNALELFIAKKAFSVVSVNETEHSPLWCNTIDSSLSMEKFLSEDNLNKRSQELPVYYRLNGAIYIVDKNYLFKEKKIFAEKNIYAFIMKKEH